MPQPSVASSDGGGDAAGLDDAVAHRALERVPGAEVAVERPVLREAAREPEARACPSSCGGSATAAGRRRRAGRSGSSGPQPSAPSTSPQAASTSATHCDVRVGAAVRRAREREVAVAEPEALEHAGAHAAERLQRLDRRAREHGQVRVRPGRRDPSGCTTHQATRCSDSTAPPRRATTRVRSAPPASARGSPRSSAARRRARTSRRRRPPCPRAACRSRRSARSRSRSWAGRSSSSRMALQFGSSCGTQRILSSWPLSSDMRNTATALTGIRQPGERRLGHADHRVERVAVLAAACRSRSRSRSDRRRRRRGSGRA